MNKDEEQVKKKRKVSLGGESSSTEAKRLKKEEKVKKSKHKMKKAKKKKKKKSKKEDKEEATVDARSLMMRPMTPAEWEERQSRIRRVKDEETGRIRLIKGDGEVLEEIVSKSRHQDINRRATQEDGLSFQKRLGLFEKS